VAATSLFVLCDLLSDLPPKDSRRLSAGVPRKTFHARDVVVFQRAVFRSLDPKILDFVAGDSVHGSYFGQKTSNRILAKGGSSV
jgi:hypothetical protein